MKTKSMKPVKSAFLCVLVIALSISISLPALAEDTASVQALRQMGNAFANIAEKASAAVVGIEAERAVQSPHPNMENYNSPFGDDFFERFFGPQFRSPQGRQRSAPQTQTVKGSGFIISEDGYILTNNHLAEDAQDGKVKVRLNDNKTLDGKVVGADPGTDVAVIKIDAKDLPYLELADSSALKVGEWVVAIGNPFGLSHTVTAGIVSAKGRNALNLEDVDFQDFIQTDAAINPGNSGGPLLNLDAEVVGINSAILGVTGNVGIGFAIPINMAKNIADQLIENGKVVRGYLGIQMEPMQDELAQSLDLKENSGAVVGDVGKDTPADKAGLKRYDVIIEVDGDAIKNPAALSSKIASYKPGSEIKLTIIRNGREKKLDVVLGERTSEALAQLRGGNAIVNQLGFTVMNLNDEIIDQLGLDKDTRGVVIDSIEMDSEAARKGLTRGLVITEVNRKPVRNEKEFNDLIEDAVKAGKETVLLYVMSGSRGSMVILKLPKP